MFTYRNYLAVELSISYIVFLVSIMELLSSLWRHTIDNRLLFIDTIL